MELSSSQKLGYSVPSCEVTRHRLQILGIYNSVFLGGVTVICLYCQILSYICSVDAADDPGAQLSILRQDVLN